MTPLVLGLDLSLTGTGMVAVPGDWGGDWGRIERRKVGYSVSKQATEAERVGRLTHIADEVIRFVDLTSPTIAVLEQYAMRMGAQGVGHACHLGELGGVVKADLWRRRRVPVDVVAPASARKLVLGKLPRSGVKAATRAAVREMGLPDDWSDDEADAFVVANWSLSALGGFAFVVEQAPPAPKKKKRAA